jgi:hypothetical protein
MIRLLGTRVALAGFALVALVALVLAHDLVFLVRYGSAYGEALAHAGHDERWQAAVLAVLGLGGGLLVAALVRLRALAREATGLDRDGRSGLGGRALLVRAAFRTWLRLAASTLLILTVQENVERVGAGFAAPGPGLLLSPEYPWALPIVVGVSLVVGFVTALFRWRRDALIARIRAQRARHAAVPAAPRPVVRVIRRPWATLGRLGGLRAPPLPAGS